MDNDADGRAPGCPRVRKTLRIVRSSLPMAGVLAGAMLTFSSDARAVDHDTLSKLLYSPYLAMNYSMMCALRDPGFHSQTVGPRGSMPAYAEHIKAEVITSLSSAEARSVMVNAADAAKARARAELRSLASGDQVSAGIMAAWCENIAKPFIRKTIETHDARHGDFETLVANAKKRP